MTKKRLGERGKRQFYERLPKKKVKEAGEKNAKGSTENGKARGFCPLKGVGGKLLENRP